MKIDIYIKYKKNWKIEKFWNCKKYKYGR